MLLYSLQGGGGGLISSGSIMDRYKGSNNKELMLQHNPDQG